MRKQAAACDMMLSVRCVTDSSRKKPGGRETLFSGSLSPTIGRIRQRQCFFIYAGEQICVARGACCLLTVRSFVRSCVKAGLVLNNI